MNKNDIGLYGDNDIIILRNCNELKTDKIRKQVENHSNRLDPT